MKLMCPYCNETHKLNFEETVAEQDYQWHEDEFRCLTCGRRFQARFELMSILGLEGDEED